MILFKTSSNDLSWLLFILIFSINSQHLFKSNINKSYPNHVNIIQKSTLTANAINIALPFIHQFAQISLISSSMSTNKGLNVLSPEITRLLISFMVMLKHNINPVTLSLFQSRILHYVNINFIYTLSPWTSRNTPLTNTQEIPYYLSHSLYEWNMFHSPSSACNRFNDDCYRQW